MILTVEHASFHYAHGPEVLHDITLSVTTPQVMSILGRNGAGKTTFLKCLLGFESWTSGATLIDGVELKRLSPRELWSRVGYVAQARSGALSYTVRDMVVLGRSVHLGLFARPGLEDWKRTDEALEAVGLTHLANARCDEISGGELQLALVARALAGDPELLVLDEPESNLDYKNQLQMLKVLRELKTERGIGAIINTHFPSHAFELSDTALVMLPGTRTRFGPVREVVTEETLSESFGVPVRLVPENLPERPGYTSVIAVGKTKTATAADSLREAS